MKKKVLRTVLLLFISISLKAQNYRPNYLLTENTFISNNFIIQDSTGWFRAKNNSNISSVNFLTENKTYFGLGIDDGFILKKTSIDNLPFLATENQQTHERYNQTYKGVPVEFAEFFIHHKANIVKLINCKVAEGLNMTVTPTLSESQALTAVVNILGSSKNYSWLDLENENDLKEEYEDSTKTSFPIGELVIAKINNNNNYQASQYVLAWKFTINILSPIENIDIYINAHNGSFIKKYNNICGGTAHLMYNYGLNKPIDTRWRGVPWNHYILFADDNLKQVHTKYPRYRNNGSLRRFGGVNVNNIIDQDDFWDWNHFTATTPHWAVTEAWDYFKTTFNRDGMNGLANDVKIYADIPESVWNGGLAYIADAQGIGKDVIMVSYKNNVYQGVIDGCAHEFTHGITEHSAGLIYADEPGALDESFCDIFGFMVERYTQGGVINDWDMGEESVLKRRMNHPTNSPSAAVFDPTPTCSYPSGQPSRYNDPSNWYTGTCDYGGVHINSGVQNYWFYLLSQGSTNAPDGTVGNIYVDGIGVDKAAEIAYMNLTVYLGFNSNYNDAFNGSLFAAYNIFGGECSNEFIQTNNAWAAVAVGQGTISNLKINGTNIIDVVTYNTPLGGYPIVYIATGQAPPYTWTVNNTNWVYNVSGPGNNTLSITNLQNNYTTTSIQVNSECAAVSKSVNCRLYWGNVDPNQHDGGLIAAPNPIKDLLHLIANFDNADDNNPWQVSIINMLGIPQFQSIYANEIPSEIEVSNLNAGNYIVLVQKGANYQTVKIVKE